MANSMHTLEWPISQFLSHGLWNQPQIAVHTLEQSIGIMPAFDLTTKKAIKVFVHESNKEMQNAVLFQLQYKSLAVWWNGVD